MPLSDLKIEKNIIGSSLMLFKNFIHVEFEKTNAENIFRYSKSRSNPPENFGSMKSLDLENLSEDENYYWNKIDINAANKKFMFGFDYMKSGDNRKYDLDINSEVSPDMTEFYLIEA